MNPKDLHWLCSVPIGGTISLFGLVGNLISILVWQRLIKSKHRSNPSTGLYLIALGICDSGLIIFFLLTDTIKTNHPEIEHNYHYAAFYSWFGFPAFFFFLVASIWLVVGVTINRWVMIAFPTKVHSIYSINRTYAGIGTFLIFSLFVNMPHFFNFHPKEVNGTYSLALTDYGKSQGSVNYEFWVHCIVLVLGPWLIVAVLNGIIVYKLSEQMKKFTSEKGSKQMKKAEAQERKMTRMLLLVTFTFLLLLAWQCISQCFFMLGVGKNSSPPHTNQWTMVDTAFAVGKLGVIINSSINWFFYCLSGTVFRKEVKKIILGSSKSDKDTMTSLLSTRKTQKSSVKFSKDESDKKQESSALISDTSA